MSARPWIVAASLGFVFTLGCAGAPHAAQTGVGQAEPGPIGPSEAQADPPGRQPAGTKTTRNPRPRPPARHGAPASGTTLPPLAAAFVAAHDFHRAQVSPVPDRPLPSVRWSEELAAQAQAWANRCEFEHSPGDFGENLSARTDLVEPDEVVAGWAAEGEHYNYARNRCAQGEVCGHYTQVVWRDSTEIGCALARCGAGGPFGGTQWVFWVCNYSPAGNWMGERPY